MLNISLDMKPPTIEERCNIMRRNISKVGITVDYDRFIEIISYTRYKRAELGSLLLTMLKSNEPEFTKNTFSKWVYEHKYFLGFTLTDNNAVSFKVSSIQSFIDTNAYGEEVSNIAKVYLEWNKLNSSISLLPNIIANNEPTGLETEDGRRIAILNPKVVAQNTGRFGFTDPALMNLPRTMKDIYVAPKGWTLITADSGQIEPKLIYGFYIKDPQILKLIDLYGDAYFGVLHYCKMPKEYIDKNVMNFKPVEITDELKALRQKLKTFGNGVMYGSTSNPEQDPLKQAYIDRIGRHPLRERWFNELREKLLAGQREFPTLFGTPIDIYKSEKYMTAKSEKLRMLALEHCIINNPVQGTAGDLMGFSLQASDELFRAKSRNSWIMMFVHDEGKYCVYNEDKDYILEELIGHTSYNIDNRVKIFNDPFIGRKLNSDIPCSYNNIKVGKPL